MFGNWIAWVIIIAVVTVMMFVCWGCCIVAGDADDRAGTR